MQDQTNRSPADEDDQADTAVLVLLLSPDEHGLWSVEEVERAMVSGFPPLMPWPGCTVRA